MLQPVLDKNISMSTKFYAYITEKSHTKISYVFLTGGAYAPYATCMFCMTTQLYENTYEIAPAMI